MTEWYDFSDVKSSKMLSFDKAAEAYGLKYPRPLGENFSLLALSDEKTDYIAEKCCHVPKLKNLPLQNLLSPMKNFLNKLNS